MDRHVRTSVRPGACIAAAASCVFLLSACAPKPPENIFPPILNVIPDQAVPAGYAFASIPLNDFLGNRVEEINWSATGQESLTVTIEDAVADVQAPDGWSGLENLQFSACDRWDRCATDEANFIRFDEDDLLIGFFGVDGFLISHGGQNILIDALIAEDLVVDPLITETLLAAQPPMQSVDLMLITHIHDDHYAPNSVLEFLRSHPETEVISTSQVVADLLPLLEEDDPLRDRIQAVEFDEGEETGLTVNQIRLTVFDLPHPGSTTIENHGFMLHLGNLLLLHTGDLDFNFTSIDEYPFSGYPIDYAFLPTIMVTAQTYPAIQEWLGDAILIPMHYSTTGSYASLSATALQQIQGWFPESIIFSHELQYWLSP